MKVFVPGEVPPPQATQDNSNKPKNINTPTLLAFNCRLLMPTLQP